jgi:pimeloyl-ACP methyl ester carboxylesterase
MQVERARLVMDDYGDDDGRTPIVLLHGLTFSRHTWRPVIDALLAADPHGDSPPQPPHDITHVAALVHDAIELSSISAPLMVGHSMSGAMASMYAAKYPVAGVFNVDQPLDIRPFAALLGQLGPALRGPGFDQIWRDVFFASFHTELLPPAGAALVNETCNARQDVVLSYWRQVMEEPIEDLLATIEASIAPAREKRVPYTILLGREPEPGELDGLREQIPWIDVHSWPNTGHLPHLADPDRFAQLLLNAARST